MSKRTLDIFFAATPKKPRIVPPSTFPSQEPVPQGQEQSADPQEKTSTPLQYTSHPTYPWPVPHLPPHVASELETLVTAQGKEIRDQPHLDLLYFQPFIPTSIARDLFNFLRSELFFYRVKYTIKRFGKETLINTPRFTTVFGLDETSLFAPEEDDNHTASRIVEASDPSTPVKRDKYKCTPRPIPECLDFLRRVTEATTDTKYNFCLVNYYASGSDSISYHSDDEWFLGPEPAIASFTLGARRDFLMRHKPPKEGAAKLEAKDVKLPLGSGDMVLMRGPTQANWLHSIPKRKGAEADRGRINITLRRAMVPAGTENYYRYNVGDGGVYKWDGSKREMLPWPHANRSG
jgi:alkylated DNA repair dioxygenase AlkB